MQEMTVVISIQTMAACSDATMWLYRAQKSPNNC